MKEKEYIISTNRVKVSIALSIIADVLADDSGTYGILTSELQEIKIRLSDAQDKIFDSFLDERE